MLRDSDKKWERRFLRDLGKQLDASPRQIVLPIRTNYRGRVPRRLARMQQLMEARGYRLAESQVQSLGGWNSFGHATFERADS